MAWLMVRGRPKSMSNQAVWQLPAIQRLPSMSLSGLYWRRFSWTCDAPTFTQRFSAAAHAFSLTAELWVVYSWVAAAIGPVSLNSRMEGRSSAARTLSRKWRADTGLNRMIAWAPNSLPR